MNRGGKTQVLESLRRDLSRFESGRVRAPVVSLGAVDIDRRLSGGRGLSLAGLHEVVGTAYPDMAAAAGFAAALGSLLQGHSGRSLLWVVQRCAAHDLGGLYGPGLAMLGIDPKRLVVVSARDDREALWVTEEALRTPDLAGVVTELEGARAYDLKASRRLQLAAEKFERPALLLAGHAGNAASAPSAALTRFRISSAPSAPNSCVVGSCGLTRFGVSLDRVRGGAPSHFILEWNHAAGRFAVATSVSRRAGVNTGGPRPEPAAQAARAGRYEAAALAS